jgi:predicted dehydrogenase
MSDKKGIGIIGFGGFGVFLRASWDAMDEAQVVAVCDSDTSRAPEGVRFYTQFEDMLADDAVDIVSIATPPSSHKELCLKAMRAGKHVLIEKPLALSINDCDEIRRVAAETGRSATVNFVLRHNRVVDVLRRIVREKVFGELRRVDLRNYATQETVPEGHWFWEPDVSGRILLEHGVHFFDLIHHITGATANDVWSLGVERKAGMEDRVFAAVKYDTGMVGTYWHSFSRPRELETTTFHFAFDLGEIEMIGWIPLELQLWGWTSDAALGTLREMMGDVQSTAITPRQERSSEFTYDVAHEVKTNFALSQPKLDIYASGVREVMADLIRAIDDPSHKMLVTLEAGAEAVRIAQLATEFAHPPCGP